MLLAYWASRIQFEEDVTKLIPASEGSAHVSEVLRSANFADKTVINISASDMGDIDALKAYADSFAMAIRHAAAPYIARLQVRLEDDQLTELMAVVAGNLPLFLGENDSHRIDSLLQPDSVVSIVDRTYRGTTAPPIFVTAPLFSKDTLGPPLSEPPKFQRPPPGG